MNPLDRELRVVTGPALLILGVGNLLRGDDGVGPAVVAAIKPHVNVPCLDAGPAPEKFLEIIVRAAPATVLIIDAVDFGGEPGEIRLLDLADLRGSACSTHATSLALVGRYLETRIQVRVRLIGVQPLQLRGEQFSAPVAEAVQRLAGSLRRRCR